MTVLGLLVAFFVLALLPSHLSLATPYVDNPFQDPYGHIRFTLATESIASWPRLPVGVSNPKEILALSLSSPSTLLLLASNSLWVSSSLGSDWERVDIDLFGKFKIRSGCRVQNVESAHWAIVCPEFIAVVQVDKGSPHGMKVIGEKLEKGRFGLILDLGTVCPSGDQVFDLFVGGSSGLFIVRMDVATGDISVKEVIGKAVVPAVAVLPISSEMCSVSFSSPTLHRVFVFDSGEAFDQKKWIYFWALNSVESEATTLAFDVADGSLHIGSQYAVNILDGDREAITRVGGIEGLPFGNITTLLSTKYRMFYGTTHGVVAFDKRDSTYHWMSGDRYVHGTAVRSLRLLDPTSDDGTGGLIVSTESGGGIIDWKHWSLEQKATHYENMVEPRHDRFGLVSDVGLKQYGDLSTYEKRSSDNDGLWTSIYLDGEIFRYAATKSTEAKEKAWKHFGALEFLATVSGERGFPSRSILPAGAPLPGGEWFNSTVFPDFQFKADTSSDEIIGHALAYQLMYDLVAETEAEKSRVADLVDSIVGNIVAHDFYLLDYNSTHPTTWGKWNWFWLNEGGDDYTTWPNNRGLNSMEILGMVLSAYYMTGKETYLQAYRKLVNEHGYGRNVINTKIMSPVNINHSDDELESVATLLLHVVLTKLKDAEFDDVRAFLQKCVRRSHKFIEREKSAMFDTVYAVVSADGSYDNANIAWTLKTWPQELIDWPIRNSIREDVRINPEPRIRAMRPNERMKLLPYDELGMYRWNGDPHTLDGGSGHRECDPGAWVFGYWMARYYGLIQNPSSE